MSSSAILSDALSVFSKNTHQIIADVEARSRSEVARVVAEANEACYQRDKALKDLHASQLEAQGYKQESTVAKSQYTQAELTIAHNVETLGHQAESIAQLRREVNQWKDQSKNWQEHFLRVEQERCALSSRLDELVSERLALSRSEVDTYSPRSRYPDSLNASKGFARKEHEIPSPAQSSSHKSGVMALKNDQDSPAGPPKKRTAKASVSASKKAAQQTHAPSGIDSPLSHVKADSQARQMDTTRCAKQEPTIRQSTIIRRVQAVIHVKQEESDEEVEPKAESNVPQQPEEQPKSRRRRSRIIVEDEKEESEGLEVDSQAAVARKLRPSRGGVDYEESEAGESDEDELMMGKEDNHGEVFGSSKPDRRAKGRAGPPTKKRKVLS